MNLGDVKNLASYYVGDPTTIRDAASSLSNALFNQFSNVVDNADVISSVFASMIAQTTPSLEDVQSIYDTIKSTPLNVTTPGNRALALKFESTGSGTGNITFGDASICSITIDDDTVNSVVGNYDGTPLVFTDGGDCSDTIESIANALSAGVQSTKLYADVLQVTAQACDGEKDLTSSINALIQNASVSNLTKSTLISIAANGPAAVVSYIVQMLNSFKEDEENPGVEFSTDVVVNEFSWGMVGGVLLNITQIAGAIALALGPVFRIVGTVLSAITSIVSNAINSWVGSATGTTFAVRYANGLQSFDLVLSSRVVDDQAVCEYIRSLGYTSFIAYSQLYPSVIVGTLYDNEDPTDFRIKIQELPSINFSFLQNITFTGGVAKYNSNYLTEDLKFRAVPKSSDDSTTQRTMIFDANLFSNEHHDNRLCGGCYHPINLSIGAYLDSLKDYAKSDVLIEQANLWCERLMTSVICWINFKLNKLFNSMRGVLYTSNAKYIYMPPNGKFVYGEDCLQEHLFKLLNSICLAYTGVIDAALNDSLHNINFRDQQDAVMRQLKTTFNHLYWQDLFDGAIYDDIDFGYVNIDNADVVYFRSASDYANCLSPQAFVESIESLDFNLQNYLLTGVFIPEIPSKCAVKIPTATIASLFWGILVDVGIALATTAVVVAAVAISVKVKRKMARKQVDIEAKKYHYESTLTGTTTDPVTGETRPYTLEEQEKAWNDYRTSRFKYNLFASFTGNSKISLGAYDDSNTNQNDTNGLLNQLTGLYFGAGEEDSVRPSVLDIIRLIRG